MFDPRPDLGRPDRGILFALRAEPASPRMCVEMSDALSSIIRNAALRLVDIERLRRRLVLSVQQGAVGVDVQASGPAVGPVVAKPRYALPSLAETRAVCGKRLAVQGWLEKAGHHVE